MILFSDSFENTFESIDALIVSIAGEVIRLLSGVWVIFYSIIHFLITQLIFKKNTFIMKDSTT